MISCPAAGSEDSWLPVSNRWPANSWHKNIAEFALSLSHKRLCVYLLNCLISDSLWPYGLYPTRLLCPWDSVKNTGVGCRALLQGIFPPQGLNPCLLCLLHQQAGSLPLGPPGKPPVRGSVQSLSHVRLFTTLWTAACQASLSIINSRSLPKPMSIELVMPSNPLILCRPLLLLPSIFPSIGVFSNESALHIRWPKYWSFSFKISPSNEYSGVISFGMDRLDLLAVQGTLKSLLQHYTLKASVLRCSAFFTVQLSHPYMTTGKTIALTRWTFVDKVMSLLFNMLSRLIITLLPRSKHLLISWLQSPTAVILEPRKIKSATVSTVSPSICYEVMGLDAM